MYAGRGGNGLLGLTIALGLAATAVLPIVLMARDRELSWKGTAFFLGGFVGLQVVYTDSYQLAEGSGSMPQVTGKLRFPSAHRYDEFDNAAIATVELAQCERS